MQTTKNLNKAFLNEKQKTQKLEKYEIDYLVMCMIERKIVDCRARGVDWKVSFQVAKRLFTAKKCFYTGVTLTRSGNVPQLATDFTIDRIDSSLPYQDDNVVACSHSANDFKNLIESRKDLCFNDALKILEKTIQRGVK